MACWHAQQAVVTARRRAYFRCTHRRTKGSHATKHVQRADGDPLLFDVVYHGAHTCAQARQHDGGRQGPPSLVGAEKQRLRLNAGQEQSSSRAAETEGIQWLDPMTPFSFPSSRAGTGSGSSAINGCFAYVAGGVLRVDMDFEIQLDELFLNPSESFQPEIQNMWAAN